MRNIFRNFSGFSGIFLDFFRIFGQFSRNLGPISKKYFNLGVKSGSFKIRGGKNESIFGTGFEKYLEMGVKCEHFGKIGVYFENIGFGHPLPVHPVTRPSHSSSLSPARTRPKTKQGSETVAFSSL